MKNENGYGIIHSIGYLCHLRIELRDRKFVSTHFPFKRNNHSTIGVIAFYSSAESASKRTEAKHTHGMTCM